MSASGSTDVERQTQNNDGATWWCKLLARGVGCIAAIIVGITGIFTFIDLLHPICIVSGCLMMGIFCILVLLEAPICCSFFESTKKIGGWLSDRPYWQKGLLYIVISIIPVAICPGLTTIIGCLPPFATGVIYGLMSLGRKANRGEMLAKAGTGKFERFENEAG